MIRTFLASVAVFAALTLLSPVQGQQHTMFFTGADPRSIKFTPIDVSRANRATSMSNMIRPARQPQPFVLSNMFRSLTLGSWPPQMPSTPFLKQGPFSKVIFPKKNKK